MFDESGHEVMCDEQLRDELLHGDEEGAHDQDEDEKKREISLPYDCASARHPARPREPPG